MLGGRTVKPELAKKMVPRVLGELWDLFFLYKDTIIVVFSGLPSKHKRKT
jgi:hypothetical protein